MKEKPTRLTPGQAWEKMKSWCAWQERCHFDVMQKLRAAGLTAAEADVIVSRLIEENYLDEERFAKQFAGGHFRQKKWGRQKIVYALKQKQVSDYCIKKALEEIDGGDYQNMLSKLARAKWEATAKGTPAQRWAKTRQYLLQKGYSSSDVLAALKHLQAHPTQD